jgi:DNA-binding CsgD family transcriptional regulator/PAS domain-containing protein
MDQVSRLKTEMAQMKDFFAAVIEHIPEAVAIVDVEDLTIKSMSKFGRALLCQRNKNPEGVRIDEFSKSLEFAGQQGPPRNREQLQLVHSLLNGETLCNEECLLKGPDGNDLNLVCNSGPVVDREGNTIAGIIVWRDVTKQKKMEEELRTKNIEARKVMEQAIEANAYRVQEVNSALKTLLRQRDEDRKEFEEAILTNIENLIMPYIKRLKSGSLSDSQSSLLDILESHLNELTSKFAKTLAMEYRVLTPTEMRVAALVRDGRTSKEIADLLCVSEKTASFHRNNIRNKLGMKGTGANLRSHLLSLV